MIRAAVSGILLLLLWPRAALAQAPVLGRNPTLAAQPTAPAPRAGDDSALPDFGSRTVPGESVVDLADFVSTSVATSGTIPDLAQLRTSDGHLRTMSAAEVFVLLARTAYLWRTTGNLPETVPITPDDITPPVLDYEDVVSPPADLEVGREIPTEPFLEQCSAVVRWADRLQVIPTAVWVDGKRLSASEYLAGLAICISYAYWEGGLADSLSLPAYAPPTSWARESEAYYAEAEYAQEEGTGEEESGYEAQEWGSSGQDGAGESGAEYEAVEAPLEELEGQEEELPLTEEEWEEEGWGVDWWAQQEAWGEDEYGAWSGEEEDDWGYEGEAWDEGAAEEEPEEGAWEEEYYEDLEGEVEEPQRQIAPRLTVIPEPGETVSGVVDVVASYSGPPAKFVIFTFDAKTQVMMNAPPYSSRWDTSRLEPGTHQVRIQVLGQEDDVLIDQTSAYTVVAPSAPRRPEASGG